MVIGIVGNYGNNNQGDEAILEGILYQLQNVYQIDRQDIIVFSNQPDQTREKYGVRSANLYYKKRNGAMTLLSTMFKNRSIIRDLDILLIGGGGIFMDLYGREAFLFGMYGWIAKLSKTPVVLYAVGAGPILTRIGKVILRSLAHLSKLVTVRDPKSKELLQSIGVKSPIHVIADPAFQIKAYKNPKRGNTGLQIGVTAVPYHHESYWPNENVAKYDQYIQGMARNLDYLLEKHPDASINFFATKYPQDILVTEEIQALMTYKDRCTICRKSLEPEEIAEFAGEQDALIGTRLHSLILALATGTPIIGVSYHHKVQDFMDMIDCGEYSIPIHELLNRPDFFYTSYSQMNSNWKSTLQRFDAIASQMEKSALSGMKLVQQSFPLETTKKILVLSNMYPSEHAPTFGIFVKNQVELLRHKGLDVDVIAINDPGNNKFALIMKYGLFFMKNIWNLIVRGRKYDAIHVHYIFPTGLIGLLYKRLFGKRLIVTAHGGDIDQMSKKSNLAQKYTRKILERSDRIIAVGEELKDIIQKEFQISEDKVSVINMGVNRNIFRNQNKGMLREELDIPVDERVLLFVGNLIRAKGLDDLLVAYERMQRQTSHLSLHLIGSHQDQAYVDKLKQQTMNNDTITIHDPMLQEDIADWMGAADIFILPSHIEGFGLVALEAMACSVPVIGSNVGGLRYLLADDAGVTVEPHNSEDIADQVISLLSDEERQVRLIIQGQKKAYQYDQEKLIELVISLYE